MFNILPWIWVNQVFYATGTEMKSRDGEQEWREGAIVSLKTNIRQLSTLLREETINNFNHNDRYIAELEWKQARKQWAINTFDEDEANLYNELRLKLTTDEMRAFFIS